MSATATAAPPEESLVAQPKRTVTFISRRQNLRLVKVPRRHERSSATGEITGETQGQSLQFDVYLDPVRKQRAVDAGLNEREAQAAARYGRFECPTEGVVTLEYGLEADAADVFRWLSKHRLNGDGVEGFWRVDPSAPPMSREELDRITKASIRHDVETLAAIVEQERAGWDRQDLIAAAEEAIAEVERVQAEIRAELEAEDEAKKAAAKRAKKSEPMG
jgi:hypothetical protein